MKLIFRFKKTGRMAYIAHLDLQRTLLRILRMTGLKPAYSAGFNPHPKMSLALPLSLGFESLCEYLEVETEKAVDLTNEGNAILSYLNKVSPDGLLFTGLSEKRELAGETPAATRSRKSLASRVMSANYDIFIPVSVFNGEATTVSEIKNNQGLVSDFMRRESILVEKKNFKKGTTSSIDIRPQILLLEVTANSAKNITKSTLNKTIDCAENNIQRIALKGSFGDINDNSSEKTSYDILQISVSNTLRLSCTLSATAGAVLSPLTLIEAFSQHLSEHCEHTIDETFIKIVRTNINFAYSTI